MEPKKYRSLDPSELIAVAPERLQDAFDKFKGGHDAWEKPGEHEMYRAFSQRLQRLLELNSLGDVAFDLPASKSSWQRKVQRLGDGERISLPLAVCQQIYALTGVEVTPANANFRVYSAPLNSTDMVTLGGVTFVPDADDPTNGELRVGWIQIEGSNPKVYKRADFGHNGAEADEYAKVVYYLEAVSLKVAGASTGSALLISLSDGEKSDVGSSTSLELRVDSTEEKVLRWNARCPHGRDALEGICSDLRLARIDGRGDDLRLEITVDPLQIEPEIKRLDGEKVTRNERGAFRRNVEKQIFRQRIRDEGRIQRFLLSFAYATDVTNAEQ